mmetsp:Transcript_39614/g.103672  ORF Transcript_39614/g.103672 Transcript_39614/m.103672 type:complete len:210 (+) Transcript_39614:230-859(+)
MGLLKQRLRGITPGGQPEFAASPGLSKRLRGVASVDVELLGREGRPSAVALLEIFPDLLVHPVVVPFQLHAHFGLQHIVKEAQIFNSPRQKPVTGNKVAPLLQPCCVDEVPHAIRARAVAVVAQHKLLLLRRPIRDVPPHHCLPVHLTRAAQHRGRSFRAENWSHHLGLLLAPSMALRRCRGHGPLRLRQLRHAHGSLLPHWQSSLDSS